MKRAKNIYFGNTPVVKVLLDSNVVWPIGSIIEPDVAKPANNEIWYTNGSTTVATEPGKYNGEYVKVFGANVISNTFDANNNRWVILFDGDVTMIGDCAFEDCINITTVNIPDTATKIGNYAFNGCIGLIGVIIPDNVRTIGAYAFYGCTSMTSVTIGSRVDKIIYGSAFNACSSLISVYIRGSHPYLYDLCFEGNAPGRKFYVPREFVEEYKSSRIWKDIYADAIVGYDF